MIVFLHLMRRELADRRYFFPAALAIGFMPYFVAWSAGIRRTDLPEVHAGIARAILVGFLAGVPLVLGSRWLVADFAGGRRGFELARPVPAWVLCGSKLAAFALMIFGGGWLTTLPTKMTALSADLPIVAPFLRGYQGFTWSLAPLAVLGVWVIFTCAQVFSLMIADRSRVSLIDLGTVIVFAVLMGYAYQRGVVFDARSVVFWWLDWILLALAVFGTFSAWRSFQAGSLLDRAHRRHSLAMNLGLLAIGTVTALAAASVVRPDPEKLVRYTLALPNADASRWLIAGEQNLHGFEPMFAADPATGQATYLAPRSRVEGYPWLSADGRRIGFLRDGGRALSVHELDRGLSRSMMRLEGARPAGLTLGVDDRLELAVTLSAPGMLRSFSLEFPIRELAHAENEDLRGHLMPILHRAGSWFDLVVLRQDGQPDEQDRIWTASHFTFDAKSGELRRGETWTYPPGDHPGNASDRNWWREALPLLEAGARFPELATHPYLVALEGGRGVRMAAPPPGNDASSRIRPREWVIFDAANARLGSFKALAGFLPAGEIRPGLLLVGRRPAISETYPRRHEVGAWQTLLVEVPSGRILRVLHGFAPSRNSQSGRKVWLVDRSGTPHDLDSAVAEPRPLLPWHPRSASR
jgi:hypothetical protein